jgi:predicted nucleic acid-binding protein
VRRYVLDSNCYIDASREPAAWAALQRFTAGHAPRLFLSSVVAAELRAGARSAADRTKLEGRVLGPFVSRGRVITPSAAAWDALGLTLATLRELEGLERSRVRRGFAFDILLAYSCRERGMVLVTRNVRDMARIRKVFTFDFVEPYPIPTDGPDAGTA